ncbi:MAG TPA: hypothetical protein VJT74_09265 [Pyrinomonadaceae bacterium]|nr:hypothetical protein [Pyrinomonadaceae bacterium]
MKRLSSLVALLLVLYPLPARACAAYPSSDAEILSKIKRFFESEDRAERLELARRIAANDSYHPDRVSEWLHSAGLHGKLKAGTRTLTVTLEDGLRREVAVRIPDGYSPEKRWPLILAFHPTGASGGDMIRLLAGRLGPLIDGYVVAAPTDYLPLNVDSGRSWRPEQRLVLRELRRLVHVDSDRVYVTGFSQGCYAAWSYATFYGDELAGALPVACTFDAAPEIPGLWELLLPNVSNVPLLHVWGSEDNLPVYGIDLKTVKGVAAKLNQRVKELTERLGLNVQNYVVEGGGHTFEPPAVLVGQLLKKRRVPYPTLVRHRFRYLVQGRASWLEALSWDGDRWMPGPVQARAAPAETREQAIGRRIAELSGLLEGEVRGQKIKVVQRHVRALVLWLGEGMIDWDAPIEVTLDGEEVFKGKVTRDLYVCLTEAARTFDFDRLRWAGLQLSKGSRAALIGNNNAPRGVIFEQ